MYKLVIPFLLWGLLGHAQDQPEVFEMNIKIEEAGLKGSHPVNASNDPGYDNQPSFISNTQLLFAASNGAQTDIGLIDLETASKAYIHPSTPGGEYSPQQIPGSKDIAAVRLDPDGKQRLYRYLAPDYAVNQEWIPELQVAYYAFHSDSVILATVLAGNSLDLVLANNKSGKVDTLLTKAGRSIHRVPDSEAMSYTALNEQGNYDIYQLDVNSGESFFVAQLPIGIQDHIWLSDSLMLIGSGSSLFLYDLYGDGSWKPAMDLSEHGIKEITRLTVSPDRSKLAFAATLQPKE